MKKVFIVFVVSLIFTGCTGKHCIKFDGEWEGRKGGLEYCFEKEQTATEGRPVLENSDGNKLFGFSGDDLKKILGLIPSTSATQGKSDCQRMVELLKEK